MMPQGPQVYQWWEVPGPAPAAPAAAQAAPQEGQRPYEPPDKVLTTLGWLKYLKDPHFSYFEHLYLKFLHRCLTTDWHILQGRVDDEALQMWIHILRILELDRKAKVDLMLLAQSGLVGRTYANKILWKLLSNWALDPNYEDLSHKVSSEVGWARRSFDRPPKNHRDLQWWRWSSYEDLGWNSRWSPREVPTKRWDLVMGPGGEPLQPPQCWGSPHQ